VRLINRDLDRAARLLEAVHPDEHRRLAGQAGARVRADDRGRRRGGQRKQRSNEDKTRFRHDFTGHLL
jgi:hypothetical protein